MRGPWIDSHVHVWEASYAHVPWVKSFPELQREFSLEHLIEDYGVDAPEAMILIESEQATGETARLVDVARHSPIHSVVVGNLDISSQTVEDDALDLAWRYPELRGIRLSRSERAESAWLRSPEVIRGVAAATTAGLAVDLLASGDELDDLAVLVRANPQTVFVLDHLGSPSEHGYEEWLSLIGALARSGQVYCKISGFMSNRELHASEFVGRVFQDAIEAFGAERLMFGSDWPVGLLGGSFAGWIGRATSLSALLPEEDVQKICAGTAARVYRIEAQTSPRLEKS